MIHGDVLLTHEGVLFGIVTRECGKRLMEAGAADGALVLKTRGTKMGTCGGLCIAHLLFLMAPRPRIFV